jgi:hypothetical protein
MLDTTYMLLGVVGNTDSASLGLGQLGHGYTVKRQPVTYIVSSSDELTLPCVNNGDAVVNLDIAIRLISSGEREKVLADVLLAALERDGEVDEVELDMSVCTVVN